MGDNVQWLAYGAGSILLALLAGAGGSALLELLWRPRRDKRRGAALLMAEVALNTELLILQSHARQANPMGIPSDLAMSTIGWQAAAGLVTELPVRLLRQIMVLYNRYDALNRDIALFDRALEEYKHASPGTSAYKDAETNCYRIVDVFNTGLDKAAKQGQKLLPELANLAGLEETEEEKANIPNFAQAAAEHMQTRQQHLEALRKANEKRKRES